jgi:AraC-like DNA-binding protein
MKIELNNLVALFTYATFHVQGVYHYTIEPGAVGRQKSAPFPGFIFPLSGQGQYYFNGTPYLARGGNVVHGGADMRLDKRVVGGAKWEYISVLYDICGAEQRDIYLPDTHFELVIGQSPRLMELLHRLWRLFNQPGALSKFQTETLFRCALEEVFVCVRNQTNGNAQTLFERVLSYIHEHYMDALTIRGLAEQNEVNENRLYYVFNKYAGMGPGDYLMMYRLNRAKELLITGDAPICKVAESVGVSRRTVFQPDVQ